MPTPRHRPCRRRVAVVLSSAVIAASTVVSPLTSELAAGSTNKATLSFAVFVAYSGSSSYEGPEHMAGCLSAAAQVNAAGGVLGHPIKCIPDDSTSDPADAVPAATKMLTSVSNLVMVIGPSEVAPPVVPIITASQIPMVSSDSSPQYDHNTDPYFYRILPSDAETAAAMALWASTRHTKNAVSLFTNSIGAQTVVQPLAGEYRKVGGRITHAIALTPDQSSYQTEAAALVNDHPKAVFSELDAQTAATFWSEVLQIGGSIPYVIGDHATSHAVWTTAVSQAVGAKNYNFISISPSGPKPSPGYRLFLKYLKREGSKVSDAAQFNGDPATIYAYDATIIGALAMTAAGTTVPSKYRPYIDKVTGLNRTGDVIAHSYAQGVAALKRHKVVRYWGAGGLIAFNRYHNAASTYTAYKYNTKTKILDPVGTVSSAALAKVYTS